MKEGTEKLLLSLKDYLRSTEGRVMATAFMIAFFLRFFLLTNRPVHHDEGVNGWFVIQMWKSGFYDYNPKNFHGPLFFYLLQLSEALFGRGVYALRFVPAVFSVVNVCLAAMHRKFLGRSAIWATLFMAISPAMVFYGRYAIHETLLITTMLSFSIGYFSWRKDKKYKSAFVLMSASFFASFMLKETFFVFYITFFLAATLSHIADRLIPVEKVNTKTKASSKERLTPRFVVLTLLVGGFITCSFFTGFWRDPLGLKEMVASLKPWVSTGVSSGHAKPFWYWFRVFSKNECYAFFALIGATLIVWKTSFEARLYSALFIGMLLAYSLVSYKTPWLIMSILLPACFVMGFSIESLTSALGKTPIPHNRGIATFCGVLLLSVSFGQCLFISFFDHTNIRSQYYLYTHTDSSQSKMLADIKEAIKAKKTTKNIMIKIGLKQTWPMPWTLSNYPNVHYGKFNADDFTKFDLVLVDDVDNIKAMDAAGNNFVAKKGYLRDAYGAIYYYYRKTIFKDIVDI